MRFKINCEFEESIIPKDYRRLILSFFKKSLESYDIERYKFFYAEPKEKDMSFGCYLKIEKFIKDKVILKDKDFSITISIENPIEAIDFYNAFISSKGKKFSFGKENNFKVLNLFQIRETEIKKNIAVFKTLSPVLIAEHKKEKNKDWYYVLGEEKSLDVLKKNLSYNLSSRFSNNEIEKLEIIPLDIKKTVVSFYGLQFPASTGTFAIKGSKEILNHIYKSGFGSKKSIGFGCIDIIV